MRRVLIILEDYGELIFIETYFKKVGLDCLGVQNENSVADKVLEFAPDIIIANAKGRKVDGVKLAQRIKRSRGLPKFILLNTRGRSVSEEDLANVKVEAVLESPVQPRELLRTVARVGGIIESLLLEKFDKLNLFEGSSSAPARESISIVTGQVPDLGPKRGRGKGTPSEETSPPPFSPQDEGAAENWRRSVGHLHGESHERARKEREKRALQDLPPSKSTAFPKQIVSAEVGKIRDQGVDSEERLIDEERQAFVKALFSRDDS